MATSSVSSSNQVKGWILEYAIKHSLDSIMKQFGNKNKSTPVQRIEGASPSQQSSPEDSLPTTVILLWFLRSSLKHIEDPRQFENVEKLKYLVVVLHELYIWCDAILLDAFWSLHTKIKIMVIIQSLHQKSATVQLFNDYFPPWSSTYEDKLRLEYKIKNNAALELIRKDHENCRLFLFHLMLSKKNLETCYKKFLVYEWDDYVGELKQLFAGFLEAVAAMLQTTKVEDILRGDISEESSDSSNPAVCILLNSLKSCTDQRASVEKALQKVLLDLDNVTGDQFKPSSQCCSQRSSPCSADVVSQKSPADTTDLTPDLTCRSEDNVDNANIESPIPLPSPEVELVEISATSEDEPVPSTSSGITHSKCKTRRMHTMLTPKQLVKRPLVFNNSYSLFSSSDDDSS